MSLKILLLVGLIVSNPVGILHEQNNHCNISGLLDAKNGATRLHLSVNGYGKLEGDEVEVTLKRIEEIANVLEIL